MVNQTTHPCIQCWTDPTYTRVQHPTTKGKTSLLYTGPIHRPFSRTLACASPELVSAARWVRLVASAASRRAPSSLRWASPAAEAHAGMRTLSNYLGPRGMRTMGGGCGHGCGAEGGGQVRHTGANCLAAGSGLQLPCARAAAAWLGAKMRSCRAAVVTEVWGVSGGRVRGLRVALSSLLLLLANSSEVGWVRAPAAA